MSNENRIGDLLAANANLILELDVALARIATLERQVAELQGKWTNTVEAAARDWMNTPIITSVAASMPKGFSYDPNTKIAAIESVSFSDYTSQPVANTTITPHIIGPHQPCHSVTAETGLRAEAVIVDGMVQSVGVVSGQPDADEPIIVEAKP